MGIIEIILFLAIGLYLKSKRKTKMRHNFHRAEVFFFIIPFSFLIVRNHFFSSNKYLSLSDKSHFLEMYSITNSIALGSNYRFPFYSNFDCNTIQDQIIEIQGTHYIESLNTYFPLNNAFFIASIVNNEYLYCNANSETLLNTKITLTLKYTKKTS